MANAGEKQIHIRRARKKRLIHAAHGGRGAAASNGPNQCAVVVRSGGR